MDGKVEAGERMLISSIWAFLHFTSVPRQRRAPPPHFFKPCSPIALQLKISLDAHRRLISHTLGLRKKWFSLVKSVNLTDFEVNILFLPAIQSIVAYEEGWGCLSRQPELWQRVERTSAAISQLA